VLVRDVAVADAVREWHGLTSPGPLLLLPLDSVDAGEWDDESAEYPPLLAVVQPAEPARRWVRALLGHVQTVAEGAAFVDGRGAVWLPGVTAGPGPLRRRAELAALRAELAKCERAQAAATGAAAAARAALAAAEEQASAAADALAAAQQLARRAEDRRGELDRRRQRAAREFTEAEGLAARIDARRAELAAKVAKLDASGAQLGEALELREEAVRDAREQLGGAEAAQEDAREQRTAFQVRRAQAQTRLQVAAERAQRLEREHALASNRLGALQLELGTLAEAGDALTGQMERWQLDLQTRQEGLSELEGRLDDAESALGSADEALAVAERTVTETRRHAAALADELHGSELRYAELSGKSEAIRQRLETEWRRPMEELFAVVEPLDVDDALLKGEADALRQQLDALGPVNPLAIEEHEEEQKRLDFITAQHKDLTDAKQTLVQAIREIDATARELFLTTFAQVRENFRHIFMTLFGGGECDLKLEKPDQPLDCDIEVHASPRGKRTQRIHLLSSGERNLVALSLLFGIFLTKPSPFCLLDEVDAPLDDQNVGRYVRMLNQFKVQTQFIVITHNPRTTTEAADAVYGVTMQEPGVSSLVSVRMRGGAGAVEQAIAGAMGAERVPVGV
jgi:chromosome segregation protein